MEYTKTFIGVMVTVSKKLLVRLEEKMQVAGNNNFV